MNTIIKPCVCVEALARGRYSNNCQVGFNEVEFVFDFGQVYETMDEGTYHTRIITNPTYAKLFFMALGNAINDYEKQHGTIAGSGSL